jgi:hypothetical protein
MLPATCPVLYCGCCLQSVQCCTVDVACNLSSAVLWMLPATCPVLYCGCCLQPVQCCTVDVACNLSSTVPHTAMELKKTETHLKQANDRTVRRRDADSRTASGINSVGNETKPSRSQCCRPSHHITSHQMYELHQNRSSASSPVRSLSHEGDCWRVQFLQQLIDFHKTRYEKCQVLWWLRTEISCCQQTGCCVL